MAEDGGHFDPDRSLTWGNVTPWLQGKRLPLHRISEADEIAIAIYSGKNNLETFTRTLHKVPNSDVCVVAALAHVYAAHHSSFGTSPKSRDEVFKKNYVQCITRAEISDYLKLAAEGSGIPQGRVASHSLRRGTVSDLPQTACEPSCITVQVEQRNMWLQASQTQTLLASADGKATPIKPMCMATQKP